MLKRGDIDMSEQFATRYKITLFYLVFYLYLAAIALRGLTAYFSTDHPLRWVVASLLLAFAGLMTSERQLTQRLEWYPPLYLVLQNGLIFSLSLLPPYFDFFLALYIIPLSAQATLFFSQRIGFLWVGFFILFMVGSLVYTRGWLNGLPFVLLYGAACLFVGSYSAVTAQAEAARREAEAARQEAETARQESQTLLAELQEAHRQLQIYAVQAEELAATRERNHLARELHDSVTQTIFSITLTAKSVDILLEQDPKQAKAQLTHLQALAQGALAEMRGLIFELRPPAVEDEGLVPALRKHAAALQSRDGLAVELRIEGERRLSGDQERRLFRIVQEALNNISKHAQTDRAVVTLTMDNGRVLLLIEDDGTGFDPNAIEPGQATMGLAIMHERTEMMGGTFEVESCLGEGTRIRVEIPPIEGDESDG